MIGPNQAEQAQFAYGPNTARLLRVKDEYDPATLFSATPLPSRGPHDLKPGL
jgi:Berberine and berberine like